MELSHASASRALPGQSQIGDLAWCHVSPGRARVGVIDGLGHGWEAAQASALAQACLESVADLGLEACFVALDMALAHSRGAAVSLADLDLQSGRLRWAGVGNVEGVLLRGLDSSARERLLLQSGIVGCRLPAVRGRELSFRPGDRLLLHTDGVDQLVVRDWDRRLPLQQGAEALLAAHARPTDDALLWLGAFHE